MTSDPRAMREQAARMRRGADRLTLLRLRLARGLVDLSGAEHPALRQTGEVLRARWASEEYPELGRIAKGLRSGARQIDAAAVAAERSVGRRLGGYAGAGFLGRGDDAHRHVEDVAAFVGTVQGARIGGYPLRPSAQEGLLAHPSHTLGVDTPVYDEAD